MAFFTRARLFTLAMALGGILVALVLHLPLPFLFGPMFACLLAALAGRRLQGLGEISVGARTILGVAVGASLTPEVLQQLPAMAASLSLIPLYILVIGAVGMPFFRWLGYDRPTAFYAAMPGGLQDMIVFGEAAGANLRALSLIQATRILIIVTLAPVLLSHLYGVQLTNPIGAPIGTIPVRELLFMALAALVGWKGGERIGLFGASILGPMIVTAALSLTGTIHMRPPKEAILFAQCFIGIGIGVHYVGVTWRELRSIVATAIAFVLVLAVIAAVFTELVILTGLARPVEGFLAFSPGGQAEMTVLAIVAGADLGFVIAHHLARITLVITLAPIFARMAGVHARKDSADPSSAKPPD